MAVYDKPFGDLFVYFIGHVRQLPPNARFCRYVSLSKKSSLKTLSGKSLFDKFQACFILLTLQRESANQQDFPDILDRVSYDIATKQDHVKLMSGRSANFTNFNSEWNDVLRLFSTNENLTNTICRN